MDNTELTQARENRIRLGVLRAGESPFRSGNRTGAHGNKSPLGMRIERERPDSKSVRHVELRSTTAMSRARVVA